MIVAVAAVWMMPVAVDEVIRRVALRDSGVAPAGLALRWWDFLFYGLFGLVVTSFVQIGGVLLVFSYLIVPAVCANFLTARLGALLAIGWTTATVASVVGLYLAYRFDFPTGAAIVCVLGVALVLAGVVARFRKAGGNA